MDSHFKLALCSLETTQNQVKDQSKQIERLTSTMERLMSSLKDYSQKTANLTATVQGQAQQIERLTVQVQHQAKQTEEMNKESKGQSDKKGASNINVNKLDLKKSKGKGLDYVVTYTPV